MQSRFRSGGNRAGTLTAVSSVPVPTSQQKNKIIYLTNTIQKMTHHEDSSNHETKGFGIIAKDTYHDTKDASNVQAKKSDRKLMKFDEKHDISGTVGDIDDKVGFSRASGWVTKKVNGWEKSVSVKMND
jgi:hypothetical protein